MVAVVSTMSEIVPVVFCFDANFVNYAAVATFSAFKNSESKLKIYWVIPHNSLDIVSPVKEILTYKGIDITIQPVDEKHFKGWRNIGHLSLASYLRLLIPDVIQESKVIYLDCDVIVQSDLSDLFKIELGNNAIGGVHDEYAERDTAIPRIKNDQYINSGVLILQLDKLRNDQFFEKCCAIYSKFENKINWADQCIINKYGESRKTIISRQWNFYFSTEKNLKISKADMTTQFKEAHLVHFVGVIKPWSINCPTQVGDFWWEYAHGLNLPNLSRKPYDSLLLKRITDSINYRFKRFKQAILKWMSG